MPTYSRRRPPSVGLGKVFGVIGLVVGVVIALVILFYPEDTGRDETSPSSKASSKAPNNTPNSAPGKTPPPGKSGARGRDDSPLIVYQAPEDGKTLPPGTKPPADIRVGDRVTMTSVVVVDADVTPLSKWTYTVKAIAPDGKVQIEVVNTASAGTVAIDNTDSYSTSMSEVPALRAERKKLYTAAAFAASALPAGTPVKTEKLVDRTDLFRVGTFGISCKLTGEKATIRDILGDMESVSELWTTDDPLIGLTLGGIVQFRRQTKSLSQIPGGPKTTQTIQEITAITVYRRGGKEGTRQVTEIPDPIGEPEKTAAVKLENGDTVTFQCLGDNADKGVTRFLDGLTVQGLVALAPQVSREYSGTRWKVAKLDDGTLGFMCLGERNGVRWLTGRARDAAVGLTGKVGGEFVGTRWKLHDRDGKVQLECQLGADGPRWLEGLTGTSTARLARDNKQPGTYWKMTKVK